MWIYDLETFRFLDVNKTAVEVYGYDKEEFLQMTILDIRGPEDHERVKKDGTQGWIRISDRVLVDGLIR